MKSTEHDTSRIYLHQTSYQSALQLVFILTILVTIVVYTSPATIGRNSKDANINKEVQQITWIPTVMLALNTVYTILNAFILNRPTVIRLYLIGISLITLIVYALYTTGTVTVIYRDGYERLWRFGSYIDLAATTTLILLAMMQCIPNYTSKQQHSHSTITWQLILAVNALTWLFGGIAHLTYSSMIIQYTFLTASCVTTTLTCYWTELLLNEGRSIIKQMYHNNQSMQTLYNQLSIYQLGITFYFVVAFVIASNLYLVSDQNELIIYCIGDITGRIGLTLLLRDADHRLQKLNGTKST